MNSVPRAFNRLASLVRLTPDILNRPRLLAVSLASLAVFSVWTIASVPAEFPYAVTTTPPAAIVLIVVDALRADRLNAYGFQGQQPHLTGLADKATVFDEAYTNGSWTKPAISSLLTGLWPTEVGTTSMLEEVHGQMIETRLSGSVLTLGEQMRQRGYATAGFVNNPHLSEALGFSRGFDLYEHGALTCDEIAARFAAWLEGLPREQRPFAYLHMLEPHAPYKLPDTASESDSTRFAALNKAATNAGGYDSFVEWRGDINSGRLRLSPAELDTLLKLYDLEVMRVDNAVGAVFRTLDSTRLFHDTLVVLMADHGENFLEHGVIAHPATALYEPQMRIPLMIKFPDSWGILPRRVKGRVQTIDVTATVASAADGRLGRGRVLTPFAALGRVSGCRIVCEAVRGAAYYEGALKTVVRFSDNGPVVQEVYDLAHDAEAVRNLAYRRPAHSARIRARMELWRDFVSTRGGAGRLTGLPPDDNRLNELRALGYLN